MTEFPHESVLINEVLETLSPQSGDRILDLTLGLGGHASALLEKAGPKGSLVGIDADEQNLVVARQRLEKQSNQCEFVHSNFKQLPELELGKFDVILADLGVSSPHFDDADRGFSFRKDGPLDMRFDRSQGRTAAEIIQKYTELELSEILRDFGEVPQHDKIAGALKRENPQSTHQAYGVIESVNTRDAKKNAQKVFQALRIEVNNELEALDTVLETAPEMLNSEGRLGIISFHSLEDRRVKQKFRALSSVEKDNTTGADIGKPLFSEIKRKPIKPSTEEIENNPRSRSAVLRVLKKNAV
ncbi:MAG: 16S rRNA (cytosine(1402)-N(4))-methyltransferase RsmH [Candidatus Peribacter sp.]|jgi:16S rRNA (cytosine1402-N4)-methyltransferase|nr:16S rRNA (cytosine(1402)-N(4))-methyltransferase RsmH [Candidatus Peribacter sp.]MBT4392431.1 16S rRNA (cytosine(1402)-N(4))-methyltransferase RsmH [Candidatus Peribacter sp.]MBT4601239.1 16S rRNA (cytosine(1402)-N(4))-methyltransferase RsmH [Candidatus Peribacter sp.]MBT5149288.1 16S rRNA (cytosine(1402)-N(4))-methyltransferase RsmH [Candidatus Peribacter sp.]MBT5637112.1 16S rRNA (cytosine(1402)-N(4))-methyltransferase RsmH [Candidatus Peribacter sp.]